jgi:pimeloyl-ACP methyl ester carboxylesterase
LSSTPAGPAIRKRYVDVPHGQVHLRTAGDGPPVVLLHDSPRSSVLHLPNLPWLGRRFSVYALDTPGYGNSTPLPAEPAPTIPDFAAALADTLRALGLRRPAVYGFHTSSKIALALATRPQAPLGGAVLDGLSLPAAPPPEDFIASYMLPFRVHADGSHLATQWSKVLDFHRWFPWFRREAANRLPLALPGDDALHAYAVDVMMAGAAWSSAYAAAMRYAARETFASVCHPLMITCRADDVLFGYLDALPAPLPGLVRRAPLGPDLEGWRAAVGEWLGGYAEPQALGGIADPLEAGGAGLRRGYVDLPGGQVHLAVAGTGDRPPLLLLHDLPGSAAAVEALGLALASDRRVLLPDLPGCGESDPLDEATPAGCAAALLACLDRLRLETVDVYAEHLAAPLALELVGLAPRRVRRIVCHGLPPLSPDARAALLPDYCPSFAPRRDGTHWLAAWHLFGDREAAWPWFDRSRGAVRPLTPSLDAATRQRLVLDLMKQPLRYARTVAAALAAPLEAWLRALPAAVVVLLDAADPRDAGLAEGLAGRPGIRVDAAPLPAERAGALRNLLDG